MSYTGNIADPPRDKYLLKYYLGIADELETYCLFGVN